MTEAELIQFLDVAEKSPVEVARAIGGLPNEVLRYKPSPDKWCILEILGHLSDIEIVYGHRIRQMLADAKPVIAPMDENAWARALGYLETAASESLAVYELNRRHNVHLLRRIKPDDLQRSAYHPGLKQDVTLKEYVERMVSHSANHLHQIERLIVESVSRASGPWGV